MRSMSIYPLLNVNKHNRNSRIILLNHWIGIQLLDKNGHGVGLIDIITKDNNVNNSTEFNIYDRNLFQTLLNHWIGIQLLDKNGHGVGLIDIITKDNNVNNSTEFNIYDRNLFQTKDSTSQIALEQADVLYERQQELEEQAIIPLLDLNKLEQADVLYERQQELEEQAIIPLLDLNKLEQADVLYERQQELDINTLSQIQRDGEDIQEKLINVTNKMKLQKIGEKIITIQRRVEEITKSINTSKKRDKTTILSQLKQQKQLNSDIEKSYIERLNLCKILNINSLNVADSVEFLNLEKKQLTEQKLDNISMQDRLYQQIFINIERKNDSYNLLSKLKTPHKEKFLEYMYRVVSKEYKNGKMEIPQYIVNLKNDTLNLCKNYEELHSIQRVKEVKNNKKNQTEQKNPWAEATSKLKPVSKEQQYSAGTAKEFEGTKFAVSAKQIKPTGRQASEPFDFKKADQKNIMVQKKLDY